MNQDKSTTNGGGITVDEKFAQIQDLGEHFTYGYELREIIKKGTSPISLEKVLDLCCQAWKSPKEDFLLKTAQTRLADSKKDSFYFACFYFTNAETVEVQRFVGWKTKQLYKAGRRSSLYVITQHRKDAWGVLALIELLDKAAPGRVDFIFGYLVQHATSSRLTKSLQSLQTSIQSLQTSQQSILSSKQTAAQTEKKLLRKLICINDRKLKVEESDGKKIKTWYKELDFLERYGAYEELMDKGRLYYRLLQFPEWPDRVYLAERFHVVK